MFRDLALRLSTLLALLVLCVPAGRAQMRETLPADPATAPSPARLEGALLSPDEVPLPAAPASGSPPLAVPDAYEVQVGDTLVVDATDGVLVNDYDPEGDTITAANYVPPAEGTMGMTVAGSFQYIPPATTGTWTARYRITDGTDYSTYETVTLTVLPAANRAPRVVPDHYGVASGDTLRVDAAEGVLLNDMDLDGDSFTAANSYSPSHGTLAMTVAGSFTYTPDAGYVGPDSASYRIRDEHGAYSTFGAIRFTVTEPRNRAPVPQEDWYYTPADTPLQVDRALGVLRNDLDPDGDGFIAANIYPPDHGSMGMNVAGEFTYTPDAGFVGEDTATYRLRDDPGAYSSFQTLHLLVGTYGQVSTGIVTPPTPHGFALHAPAPNPFNPRTEIAFRLGEEGPVTLRVYDRKGRVVDTLIDETLPAGEHEVLWEGVDGRGHRVASGAYVVELRQEGKRALRKVSLVK